MKQDIKERWVAALRSGDYKQGKGRLEAVKPDGSSEFCCMGVLCDLALKDGAPVIRRVIKGADRDFMTGGGPAGYDGEHGVLPFSVLEWSGLTSHVPWVAYPNAPPTKGGEKRLDLVRLNDGLSLSFNEIADLIEAQL